MVCSSVREKAVAALCGLAAILLVGVSRADEPAPICVVRAGTPGGLEAQALADAVALEARKASAALTLVESATCGPGVMATIGPDARLVVRDRGGVERTLALGNVAPLDRAREAARTLVTLALTPPGQVPLLDPDTPLVAPREAEPAAEPPDVAFVLEAGPAWRNTLRAGGDLGAVEGLVGVALLGQRLLVGVEGGWEWPVTSTDGGVEATVSAGEVLGVVRGGAPVGPLVLRGGVAGGVQWRSIEASAPSRRDAAGTTSTAGVVAAEAELTWPIGPIHVGVLASARLYVGGESYTWLGQTVWQAPDGAAGLALRVGAGF